MFQTKVVEKIKTHILYLLCLETATCRGKKRILIFYIEHKPHRQITFVYIILLYDTVIVQHSAIQPHINVYFLTNDNIFQVQESNNSLLQKENTRGCIHV